MTDAKPYVPASLGRPAETPLEALTAARDIIAEEGRWEKRTWFRHNDKGHPEYDENPYCNGWVTCAAGALQLVTLGARKPEPFDCGVDNCPTCARQSEWKIPGSGVPIDSKFATPDIRLYHDALKFLSDAVMALRPEWSEYDRWACVPNFNDDETTTHDDILAVFAEAEAAAAAAETEPAK